MTLEDNRQSSATNNRHSNSSSATHNNCSRCSKDSSHRANHNPGLATLSSFGVATYLGVHLDGGPQKACATVVPTEDSVRFFKGFFRPNVTMLPACSWANRPQRIDRDVVDSAAIRTR